MRIYLFYYDDKLDWSDRGTKNDIPVEITYSEYLKLKELSLKIEPSDGSEMPLGSPEKPAGAFL